MQVYGYVGLGNSAGSAHDLGSSGHWLGLHSRLLIFLCFFKNDFKFHPLVTFLILLIAGIVYPAFAYLAMEFKLCMHKSSVLFTQQRQQEFVQTCYVKLDMCDLIRL